VKYWDSSALLPLLVHESTSEEMERVLRGDPAVVTWWGTRVECASAIARLEREGTLKRLAVQRAFARLEAAAAQWIEVPAQEDVHAHAVRLLRTHRLRAADALHVAAAIVAADSKPRALAFVTLDVRQADAAEREGFPVVSATDTA
jgi:predicted nucleic acid-binding protein